MQSKLFSFSRNVWLTIGISVICAIAFFVYAWSEKQIGRANELRHQSYLLSNELHQSSDDLTLMASTYVVTGDPIYKKYYRDILDIRDGRKPRPAAYQSVFWDIVAAHGRPPRRGNEQAIALLELMRQAGYTELELSKLEQAKANSDSLNGIEAAAMKLVEAVPVTEAGRARARMMLHDDKYHHLKADMIKPINEFNALMEKRTSDAIQAAETTALILRVVFIGFGLSLLLLLLRTKIVLRTIMGGSVDEVCAYIARIGSGDFSVAPPEADDKGGSVLGWLAKARANLHKIDYELKQAKKRDQFHREILELLASRNSLQDILASLVRGVEQFNPAMLCSVFLLDKEGKHLVDGFAPSLPGFFNAATEGMAIGMGAGSCGTAAFTGQRIIVADISSHPYWAGYKELAARAGVNACWSQPILSSTGQVLGTFAIYHREIHTPSESDIALIEELSRQASIAIERSIDAEKIRGSEAHYRLLTEDVSDVVWKQDREHRFTYISPADERMRGFGADEVIGRHAFEMMTEEGIASAQETMWQHGASSIVTQLRCKDGGKIWAEIITTPEFDGLGAVTGYHGISRNVTERVMIEAEMRQKERYQRALLDNFPFAVWLKDTGSRFLVVNDGFVQVFGANSADEVVGKNDFDIAPPDLARRSLADDREVMASRKKKNVEEEILTGGERKWFETYKAPVIGDKGALLGTVGFSRDITQRKHMEHLLESMSEEFQRSVGRELHDNLGQIISAISYQATAMQNKVSSTANDKALAADIAFIAAQARKAIAECKKLAHGLVPFELESNGLLAALREYASEISFSHHVTCELVCDNEVDIDDANLELNLFRIVQEAVNNAVRHSGARQVTISLSLADNTLGLSIRDDGSGFADMETQRDAPQGMGLKFMQYRANQIGATLKFNFPAAGGTEVSLEKRGVYE